MKATDNEGGEETATKLIDVYNAPGEPVVAARHLRAYQLSSAMVDGHPALACIGINDVALQYVRCKNTIGSNWAAPVGVSEDGDIPSLIVLANGHPALVFTLEGNLSFTYGINVNGDTWHAPISIAPINGRYSSATLVDGMPAAVFYDTNNERLAYVRATHELGLTWGIPVTVDTMETSEYGSFLSMAVIEDLPAVCYSDVASVALKYARATDVAGSSWNTDVVDDSGNVGSGSLIAVEAPIAQAPAICYCDSSDNGLYYTFSFSENGGIWNTPVLLDTLQPTWKSMCLVDGFPAVTYFDADLNNVQLVMATQKLGLAWSDPVLVDTLEAWGLGTNPVMVDLYGSAGIAYGNGHFQAEYEAVMFVVME